MAATRKRITYAKLAARAKAGTLSEKELADYFAPDEERSKPLAPAVKLNLDLVDMAGRRPRARTVNRLRIEAEQGCRERLQPAAPKRAPRRRGEPTERAAPRIRVLAEGDSWFNLPNLSWFWPRDAMDVLADTHHVKVVAFWGDEIADMVAPPNKRNYLVPLNSGLYPHFCISGGGNDVLAGIEAHVKAHGSTGTDPSNPASYIKASFAAKLGETIGHYGTLYQDVRGSSVPDTNLYVHGYANAIPHRGGEYLGRPLGALGFSVPSALAEAIVAEMVGAFNVALEGFAAARPTVSYVDMRPALTRDDWNSDEIHPSSEGAAKVAQRFREAIAANIPVA